MGRRLKLKKPKPRKSLFSGLRRTWTRSPAQQTLPSGKEYDRKKEKALARQARAAGRAREKSEAEPEL